MQIKYLLFQNLRIATVGQFETIDTPTRNSLGGSNELGFIVFLGRQTVGLL